MANKCIRDNMVECIKQQSSREAHPPLLKGFLANLVNAKSSTSIATAPFLRTVAIVDDGARGIERSSSLSFCHAQRKLANAKRGRRRTRAIDSKKMSRWDSYPHARGAKEENNVCRVPRRLSNPPGERCLIHEARQQAVHKAIVEAHKTAREDTFEGTCVTTDTSLSQTFTPCSTWLCVVAKTASYSPKPAPRLLQLKEAQHALQLLELDKTPTHHRHHRATTLSEVLRPTGDKCMDDSDASVIDGKTNAFPRLAPSRLDPRAAVLNGAPLRPRRQLSFPKIVSKATDVAIAVEEKDGAPMRDRTRHRRGGDHSNRDNDNNDNSNWHHDEHHRHRQSPTKRKHQILQVSDSPTSTNNETGSEASESNEVYARSA